MKTYSIVCRTEAVAIARINLNVTSIGRIENPDENSVSIYIEAEGVNRIIYDVKNNSVHSISETHNDDDNITDAYFGLIARICKTKYDYAGYDIEINLYKDFSLMFDDKGIVICQKKEVLKTVVEE